jgi:4-hydroxy-L-threonine phosphate dehydrogenase PdxA
MIKSTAAVTSTNLRSDGHVSTNTFRTEDILSKIAQLPSTGTILGRVLPFHYHRPCTQHLRLATVLRMKVLQHCVCGESPLVSSVSVKALDALRVGASTTDEGRAVLVLTNPVHKLMVQLASRCHCDGRHLLVTEVLRTMSAAMLIMPSVKIVPRMYVRGHAAWGCPLGVCRYPVSR